MDGMLLDGGGDLPAGYANIITRATVRDMVKRRQTALEQFERAYGELLKASSALNDASAAVHLIGQKNSENSSYLHVSKEEDRNFLSSLKLPERSEFLAVARKVVDRRMWATLIELTELERLMDAQAKSQLRKDLMDNVPEATAENIFATVQTFAADAETIFKRGIANCFSKLDRRFRSHDGWKIGSRVILTYAFSEYGSWSFNSNARDVLHDIDRVFHVLDGGTTPHLYGGIVAEVERSRRDQGYGPRQSECESDYFKVRGFMNGNAHVWFKRDDLVEKVNKLLGEYYGAPIPEEREPQDDGGLFTPKTTLAKNYGFFPTPDAAAETLLENAMLHRHDGEPPLTLLEPSAGTGNLARRAAERGAVVDCVEIQAELANSLRKSGRYRKVIAGDFLAYRPDPARLYDRVLMNPPFDRERDVDHVMHALRFLKPDGCLVAIMSAGTEFRETRKAIAFRELMKEMRAVWRDLPPGSFSSVGTNCNTIVLKVWNDRRRQYW